MLSLQGIGIPTGLGAILQDDTLERVFHEALFPNLLFRAEATPDLWPANLGETKLFTRSGLLPVRKKPLTPGEDPTPRSYDFEQWRATARQQGDTLDTHMPSSHLALASTFMKDAQTLGLNAAQTLNELVRDNLYRAYLGGNTVTTQAYTAATSTIAVASINGFAERVFNVAPVAVSPAAPITVDLAGFPVTVIGAIPDDPENAPFGRGTLVLSESFDAATNNIALRASVLADQRSRVVRAGGATSVDGVSTGLVLQDVINATARLRAARVPTMPDGTYHVHLTPQGESQIYSDEQWQRLFTALPDSMAFRDLAIGKLVGCTWYRNTENPNAENSGDLVGTTGSARVSSDVGGEIFNNGGTEIRRAIVVGGGAITEKYIDESKFITDAGAQGKIGNFTITNNGVQVMTERIRYILRSPQDRLQQQVSQTWSWSGDFPVPSDSLTFDAARYKRAVVIEHA